jgi:hypothetical protein
MDSPFALRIATLASLLSGAATVSAQEHPQRWRHELVVLDDYDDFHAGGSSWAYRAQLDVQTPVRLSVGPQSPDPYADWWWRIDARSDRAAKAEELSGWFCSTPIECPEGFQELLLSWNVDTAPGTGVAFELSVRADESSPWSDWMYVGDWGDTGIWRRARDTEHGELASEDGDRVVSIEGAKIDVDYFTGQRAWRSARFRVRTSYSGEEANRSVVVRRVALCFSRETDELAPRFELPKNAQKRLDVPFRSQRSAKPELVSRICSPTSVAMVLAYRGIGVDTLRVADRLFDATHDIYGNWTRAVQGAYSFGAPGYLTRFSDWNAVARHVAEGTPLVISIAAKPGELDGAPYVKTDGHLLVLCGFDEHGNVHVNDPAAETPEAGKLVYRRDQLERVWMARGGTAYVLLEPAKR